MKYVQAFKLTVTVGVILNIVLSVVALLAPNAFLGLMGLDPAYPTLWLQFSALLLILLSLFYLPGVLDLDRYRANAWLQVLSRSASTVFFAVCVLLLGFSRRFLIFSAVDLIFAVVSGIFLALAVRGPAPHARKPTPWQVRRGVA